MVPLASSFFPAVELFTAAACAGWVRCPEQQRLDDRADEAEHEAGGEQHQQEQRGRDAGLERPVDRGDAEIGPERVERAAREVHDLLHAEHELQPGGHEKKNGGVKDAADEDVEEGSQMTGFPPTRE